MSVLTGLDLATNPSTILSFYYTQTGIATYDLDSSMQSYLTDAWPASANLSPAIQPVFGSEVIYKYTGQDTKTSFTVKEKQETAKPIKNGATQIGTTDESSASLTFEGYLSGTKKETLFAGESDITTQTDKPGVVTKDGTEYATTDTSQSYSITRFHEFKDGLNTTEKTDDVTDSFRETTSNGTKSKSDELKGTSEDTQTDSYDLKQSHSDFNGVVSTDAESSKSSTTTGFDANAFDYSAHTDISTSKSAYKDASVIKKAVSDASNISDGYNTKVSGPITTYTEYNKEKNAASVDYADNAGYKAKLQISQTISDVTKTVSKPDTEITTVHNSDILTISTLSYSDAAKNSFKLSGKATNTYDDDGQFLDNSIKEVIKIEFKGMEFATASYKITAAKLLLPSMTLPDLQGEITTPENNIPGFFAAVAPTFKENILLADNTIKVLSASGRNIDGGAGKDKITGGDGDDTLSGGLGNDELTGGKGADKFLFKSEIAVDDLGKPLNVDTIKDFVTVQMATSDVTKTADKIYLDGTLFVNQEFLAQDKLANVATGFTGVIYETSTGKLYYDEDGTVASSADAIQFALLKTKPASLSLADFSFDGADISSSGNDILQGTDGADELDGMEGDDTLDGGAGDDTLTGGTGDDTVLGGAGDDTVDGEDDNDTVDGGNGNDIVNGGFGIDTVLGGAGTDTVDGGDDDDSVDGGDGNDTLTGGTGDDTMLGGAGDDTMDGGKGQDVLIGGLGHDTLTGDGGLDIFEFAEAGDADSDQVTDFVSGNDSINISTTLATTYTAGADLTNDFVSGDATVAALDASDHFLYAETTGSLYYDADGNGASAKILIAVLQGTPTLAADDLNIV